jgi:nicotinamide riboside kinase
LARHYKTVWVAEYGRENWEEKLAAQSLKGGDIPAWTDEDFIHIAQEQQRRENEAAKRANRVLICDTNAFATATWYERYAGRRHAEVDAIGNADKVDLYLIPTPEVPFVQDGVRDGEKIRGWMHDRFVELIEKAGVPYTLITGPWEGRVDQAIAAIDALLAHCQPEAQPAP